MTREVRRSVERLEFDATHEYRPGVRDGIFSRIEKRAGGERRLWEEYERFAGARAGEQDRSRPFVNTTLNEMMRLFVEKKDSFR